MSFKSNTALFRTSFDDLLPVKSVWISRMATLAPLSSIGALLLSFMSGRRCGHQGKLEHVQIGLPFLFVFENVFTAFA